MAVSTDTEEENILDILAENSDAPHLPQTDRGIPNRTLTSSPYQTILRHQTRNQFIF